MHLALSCYFARVVRTASDSHYVGLRRAWLAEVAQGKMLIASAVAEAGAEAWRITTTARPADGHWRLSGEKILVSLSPAATHFYTRVRVEAAGGFVMGTAMIPANAPGVTVCDDWQGLGLRGSGSGRVRLDNVWLGFSDVHLGGAWGAPDPTDYEGRAAASIPIVAAYLGIAEAAEALAWRELEKGSKSGQPRARTEAVGVRGALAEMTIAMTEARSVMQCVTERIEVAFDASAPRSLDLRHGRQLLEDCLIASLVVERAASRAVETAMQACGGRSFSAGHELARLYRDVKASSFMRPYSPPERYVEFIVGDTED